MARLQAEGLNSSGITCNSGILNCTTVRSTLEQMNPGISLALVSYVYNTTISSQLFSCSCSLYCFIVGQIC